MRMWMVDPTLMCRQHLLGEHVELHMLVGTLNKNISIEGYKKNKLMDPRVARARHDELVSEMTNRGYNHKSPLPAFDETIKGALLMVEESYAELLRRCCDCRDLAL